MEIRAKFEEGVFKPLENIEGIESGEVVEISLSALKKNGKAKSKFFGMWKDRKDIKSGLDYVKKIRQWSRT